MPKLEHSKKYYMPINKVVGILQTKKQNIYDGRNCGEIRTTLINNRITFHLNDCKDFILSIINHD